MSLPLLRRAALLGLATVWLLAQVVGPAVAGHGGTANSGPPDDALHCVDRNAVTTKVDNAVQHAIAQLDRSAMDATLSCSGDVEVWDEYYGTSGDWSNTYGRTNCEAWVVVGIRCNVYDVRYNLTYFASYSADQVKSGGCHEFGHTAGLGHRTSSTDTDDNSCMRSTVSASRPNYDSHDLDGINDVLP